MANSPWLFLRIRQPVYKHPPSEAVNFCRVGQIAIAMQTHRSWEHSGNGGSSRPNGTLDPPYISLRGLITDFNGHSATTSSSGLGASPRQDCELIQGPGLVPKRLEKLALHRL